MNEKILSAHAHVGEWLPGWRPGRDYRDSNSAKKSDGGGVLRDLSHEIDYVLWLFGACRQLVAVAGHSSSLEIDSEDQASLLMKMESDSTVYVHLNYLDRPARRMDRR